MRFRLLFFLLFMGLMMMGNAQHITMKNYQQKVPPSGLVQISQNAYRDRNPITNLDWLEYLYWLEKIYGKESEEYRAAQPDMQILLQQLRHPGVDRIIIRLHVAHQGHRTLVQLRDQDAEQRIERQQHQRPGQQNAAGAHKALFSLAARNALDQFVKRVDDRREQIGHRRAVDHGAKRLEQHARQGHQHPVVKHRVVKDHECAGRQKRGKAPVKIAFFLHESAVLSESFLTISYNIPFLRELQ